MKKTVEERLAEIQQRKSLIEKLMFKETETIKRDSKKKVSGKKVLEELHTKRNAIKDYLKSQHVNVEEKHSEETESADAISSMIEKLESGNFRSLDSSTSASLEHHAESRLDETASLDASSSLEKSEEYKELKSMVSEETLQHALEINQKKEETEVIKEDAIAAAVEAVVATNVQEDLQAKCDAVQETLINEAEQIAEEIAA